MASPILSAGLGQFLTSLGDVSPETIKLLHEREGIEQEKVRTKASEDYMRSLIGQASARMQAEMAKLEQPYILGEGQMLVSPTGREIARGPSKTKTTTPSRDPEVLAQAQGIASGPWTYEEKFRRIGSLGLNPHNFLIAPKEDIEVKKLESDAAAAIRREAMGVPEPGDAAKIAAYKKYKETGAFGTAFGATTGQAAGFPPSGIEGMVEEAIYTGRDPSMGFGPVIRGLFYKKLKERVDSLGGFGNFAAGRFLVQSMQTSLAALERQRVLIDAFMRTNEKNINIALQMSDALDRNDIPLLNRALIPWGLEVQGREDVAGLMAALHIARTESARVLQSATGAGVLTDESQRKIAQFTGVELNAKQITYVLNLLLTDTQNRRASYGEERKLLLDVVRSGGGFIKEIPPPPPVAPPAPIISPGGREAPDKSVIRGGKTYYHFKGDPPDDWYTTPRKEE